MKTRPSFFALLSVALLIAADAFAAASHGYLFVTWRGEREPREEQIHFALSKDGREWTALNGGAPVLVNEKGEGAARDPFLLRSHDGTKLYLLATDLAIHRNRDFRRAMRAGSRSIVIWESSDLVKWSAPRLAEVAHESSGCAWSPEAIYDPEKKAYLVHWSSTVSNDRFSKLSVWASYTRDFVSFDHPFLFAEKTGNLTDHSIIGDGRAYYRFAKEDGAGGLFVETAASLGGPWREIPGASLGAGPRHGGPICFPLATSANGIPSVWALFLHHPGVGYHTFVTGNLAESRFSPLDGARFPFRFHQGSVLPLREGEYERLLAAFPR